jgi:hypothetical protein
VYFFLRDSPLQFKVCAIFQLSIDIGEYSVLGLALSLIDVFSAIVFQRFQYGTAPPATVLLAEEDLEQALALAEE